MKRLVKILVAVVVLGTAMNGIGFAGPTSDSVPVDVNIALLNPNSGNVDVTARNISNDAEAPISFSITGVNLANPATHWVVSDQYLKILHSNQWNASWGLRTYTDNKTVYPAMAGNPIEPGTNGKYGDGDDVLTYGGLVHTGKLNDPTLRAPLGWVVYKDKIANAGKPPTPTGEASFNTEIPKNDKTNDWKSQWAYVSEKGDSLPADFNKISWPTYNDKNGNGQQDADEPTVTAFNYNLIAWGYPLATALAQHLPAADGPDSDTEPDLKSGDGDIAVYVTARFVSKNYSIDTLNGTAFILPAGNYNTTIWVELIHE